MRKIKISVVVVFAVLVLLLSSAGAAYSADDLANSLYSGWSSSGGGTYGSWYNVALYWLRSIGSDVDTMQSDVASVKSNTNNLSTMLTRLTSIDSSLDYIVPDVDAIRSDVSSVKSSLSIYLPSISSNSTSINSGVSSISTNLQSVVSRLISIDVNSEYLPTLTGYFNPTTGMLGRAITGMQSDISDISDNVDALRTFFDNPQHRALENATNSAVSSATDMVQSNPGGTSQAQKNQAISGFSTSAAGALDTGVSSDSAWSFLTTGDAAYQPGLLPSGRSGNIFAFFSTETMYDLDPSLATRAPQPEVVDYLSLNQQTFEALKGEGSDQR